MARTSFWSRLITLFLVAAATLTLSISHQSGAVVLAGVLEQLPADTAATTHVLSYQGRLADPTTGAPKPDGSYSMTFRIYDAAAAGTTLWTEIKEVIVSRGLFSTLLGDSTALPSTLFDGNDRWLGVKVGTDSEAAPRIRMAFVPYASWSINTGALEGQNGAFYRNASNINAGTLADGRIAGTITRDSEVMGIVTGADGVGSGLDADLLDGQNSSAFAAASHNHSGANITSGTVADAHIDPTITRDGEVMGIVTANDGSGSGLDADLLDGLGSADFAAASHNHDSTYLNAAGPDSMTGSSAGPILKVTQSGAGDAINAQGSISADRLKYNASRTHYLSIPAEAFQPGSNVAYFNTYGMGGAYISAAGGNALVAPVFLPDGATVTRLTVYFNDGSAGDLTVNFNRLSFTSGGYSTLAQVVSSGTSGYQNGSDTTIASPTIDNIGGGYLIYAYSTAWDSSLKLMGVLITYTISEAP